MISYHELVRAFRSAGLTPARPLLVHCALSSFGDEIRGGVETLIGALLASSAGLLVPAFTYKTMLTPETGPGDNAIQYGEGKDRNRLAEFFTPDMPADRTMGLFAEAVRSRPEALRSSHPILSFAGIGLAGVVELQTLADPYAPLRQLSEQDGQVLLIGVDQRVNTSIHLGEALAGRKQFVRWALTPDGVRECPHFGGCSEGFNQAAPWFESISRRFQVGEAHLQRIPLRELLDAVVSHLQADPLALLCGREECERCEVVRSAWRE